MSSAGLAKPAPAARSLSREIEQAKEESWQVLRRHEKRCQLCVGHNLCALGIILRRNFCRVLDLAETPAEWPVVETDDR